MGRKSLGSRGSKVGNRKVVRLSDEESRTLGRAAAVLGLPLGRYLALAALQVARTSELWVKLNISTCAVRSRHFGSLVPRAVVVFDNTGNRRLDLEVDEAGDVVVPLGALLALVGNQGGWKLFLLARAEPNRFHREGNWCTYEAPEVIDQAARATALRKATHRDAE